MGIRLDITGEISGINYYGQKLFGYVEKEIDKKLTSKNYLIEIGKYCNEVVVNDLDWWSEGKTHITADEFRKFCELYADDLEKYYPYGEYKKEWFLEDKDVKKLLETQEDKILRWI